MRDLWSILSKPDRHADPYAFLTGTALGHGWVGLVIGWGLAALGAVVGLDTPTGLLAPAFWAGPSLAVGVIYFGVKEVRDIHRGGQISDSYHDSFFVALGAWLGAGLPWWAILQLTLIGGFAYWGVTVRIKEQTHEQ